MLRLLLISSHARTWLLALRWNHANCFHSYSTSAVFPKVLNLNLSRGQLCAQFSLFCFWDSWLEVNLLIKLPPKKQNIHYLEEMFLGKKTQTNKQAKKNQTDFKIRKQIMPVPAFFFLRFTLKARQSWIFLKILHRYVTVLSESLLINTHPTDLASEC